MDTGEPEPISPDEARATMLAILDVSDQVAAIRRLLEEDGEEEEG